MLPEDGEDHHIFPEIESLFRKREYHECKQLLDKLRQGGCESPELYFWLGKAEARLGMRHECMNYFMVCIELEPTNCRYLREYAEVLLEFGQLEEAESYIREALTLRKNSFDSHFCFARVLFESGKNLEAKQAFTKCKTLNPGHESVCRFLEKIERELRKDEMAQLKVTAEPLANSFHPPPPQPSGSCERESLLLQQIQELKRRVSAREEETRTENLCKVCYALPIELINRNCGHFVLCGVCAKVIKKCPICQARGKYLRVFM